MSSPTRLADPESEGTLEERELIEAARAHGMPAAVKAGVWSAVVAHGVGAVASAQAAAAAGSAANSATLAGLWSWKGIVLLAAVGATTATGMRLMRPSSPTSPPPSAHVSPAIPVAVPNPAASTDDRSESAATEDTPGAVDALPRPVPRPPERRRASGAALVGTEAALPASRLADEARSLVEARRLLRIGAIPAARAALEQANREFADGHLGQEREVLLIEALAQSGQGELARSRAATFLRTYPSSPHAADVRHHAEGK
jgi:hypothetical protein